MLKTIFASVTAVAATVLLSIGASAGATVQHFNLNGPQQCYAKGDYLVCVIASTRCRRRLETSTPRSTE
jgi:hypothetical protein